MRYFDRDENGLTVKGRVERLELLVQVFVFSAIVVILALVLTGCNMFDSHAKWFGMDSGSVHDKHFEPAHYDQGTSCVSTGNGTQVCVPTQTYVPDAWNLDLYDKNGDHGWTEVSQQSFDRCKVGQWYPDCA